MYNLPNFKEQDPEIVREFIRAHPFAFLTGSNKSNRPVATQVPLFIDEIGGKLFLSGHIMRHSDHHKAFLDNSQVLAVFTGAHTYVSASWYENKQQASTWNYLSVHAHGTIEFLDHQALLDVLKRTTDHFENNTQSGANFDDLPKDYVERLSKAIVAFRIEVTDMDHVFKLSQNKSHQDFRNIKENLQLQAGDGQILAGEMERRESQLFKTGE